MRKPPIELFSGREQIYHRFRPRYPTALIDVLKAETGLDTFHTVADIGSGTGISSERFINNGNRVFAVEPNREMRLIAEDNFGDNPLFFSVQGTAEVTNLDDSSMDFVTAGQAFHWFEKEKAKAEFKRILKPGGWCVLFWNIRRKDVNEFAAEYEAFVDKCAAEYRGPGGGKAREEKNLREFIDLNFRRFIIPHQRSLDLEGLIGNLFSASYMPLAGEPSVPDIENEVRKLFGRFQQNGVVTFPLETEVNMGNFN